ncbi:MAG: toxin-antitoxin system YwqK family antitoxin [Spirobacillus cienkowskii]|jgi:antitoxin component YwqK of YwqJK toxin-antitoxin module|uniref:Toxin-antitoxin system YwqK family antitoxin n=1 Tax=Spirobacillus cienkowskii TaxID=495820 RepID=A0A369KVY8_9BACT|nr:MAG: toxin-antitoxin system YwqK family antitoxin [Spirobacillus cienkowskii]
MHIKFIVIMIFLKNYAYSSQWFCKEGASKKIEDTYEVCGIGRDNDEDVARKNALKNAFEEFDLICNKSDDCRGKYKEINPLRSDCEKNNENYFTCYRSVYITIDKLKIIDNIVNKSSNENNYEDLIIDVNKKEIERNTAPKLEDLKKRSEKIYIYKKDIIEFESNNITQFLDIKTKEPVSGIGLSLYKEGFIEKIFLIKNGFINGFSRSYYENGNIMEENLYKNGYGTVTFWYENGTIKAIGVAQNGELNGEFKLYYENGEINCIGNFTQGKLNGGRKCYYETGELKSEHLFKNGILNGVYMLYYKDEILKQRGKYCSGVVCGVLQVFYDSGELNTEFEYIKGKKEGKSTFYLKNGKICATAIYKNDKLISGKTSTGRKLNRAELVNWEVAGKVNCN